MVLPFFLDTAGNVLNLFNTTEYFDRLLHWLNWLMLIAAFGGYVSAFKLVRPNVFALALGFGATTSVLWEIMEYILMRMGAGGLQLTYRDTVEDLILSFFGSVCGSLLVVTLLWGRRLVPEEWVKRPEQR